MGVLARGRVEGAREAGMGVACPRGEGAVTRADVTGISMREVASSSVGVGDARSTVVGGGGGVLLSLSLSAAELPLPLESSKHLPSPPPLPPLPPLVTTGTDVTTIELVE